MQSGGQPQYTESAVSHSGQYLRGMSAPGDGRVIHGEEVHGILRHCSYGGEDRHSIPQHFGGVHAGGDCRSVPQHYGHTGEDCRGVPPHYREDRHGLPQHCSHTIVYDQESPVL